VPETVATPYERAQRAFARLEALGFTESGEQGRSVALALEILRAYLAARVPGTSLAQTSAELLSLVAGPRAPAVVPVDALLALLVTADAVKYAQQPLDAAEAAAFVHDARGLVEAIEGAVREREAREREARERAMQAERGTEGDPGDGPRDAGRTPGKAATSSTAAVG
jgi:hypothetical protein